MSNFQLPVWTARHQNCYDSNGVNYRGLTLEEAWQMCQSKNLYPNTRGWIISPEGKNITLGDGRTPEIEAELQRLKMSALLPFQPAL